MKNEDRSFGAQLGIIALILTMGVASMMNAGNTRTHLDMFEWTHNMTELDPKIIEDFQKKEKIITDELLFATLFIGGGTIWLAKIAWKYSKKSDDTKNPE